MDTGYDLLAASRTAGGELPYVDYVYFYGPLGPAAARRRSTRSPAPRLAGGRARRSCWRARRHRRSPTGSRAASPRPLPAGAGRARSSPPAALSSANNSYVLPHTLSAPLGIVLALGALLALVTGARSQRDAPAPDRRPASLCGLVALTRPELARRAATCAVVGVAGDRASWRRAARVAPRAAPSPCSRRAAAHPARRLRRVPGRASALARAAVREPLPARLHRRRRLTSCSTRTRRSPPRSVVELVGARARLRAPASPRSLVGAAGDRRRRPRAHARARRRSALGVLAFARRARGPTRDGPLLPRSGRTPGSRSGAGSPSACSSGAPAARDPATGGAARRAAARRRDREHLRVVHARSRTPCFPEATAYAAAAGGGRSSSGCTCRVLGARTRPRGRRARRRAGSPLLVVASAGLVVHDARQETGDGARPARRAHRARRPTAPALQQALDAIERTTRPGEPVLIAPQLTSLYVMADRQNPLPQLSLLPGVARDARRRGARDRSGCDDVRLVVVDRDAADAVRARRRSAPPSTAARGLAADATSAACRRSGGTGAERTDARRLVEEHPMTPHVRRRDRVGPRAAGRSPCCSRPSPWPPRPRASRARRRPPA